MTYINLGQDQANKRERKQTAAQVAKYCPLQQATGISRYGSLININPSGRKHIIFLAMQQHIQQTWVQHVENRIRYNTRHFMKKYQIQNIS